MNQYDQTAIDRRKFLELGGKGLATLGTGAAVGTLVGTSGCQTVSDTFTPLNEARPVHYPRLAGQKIQSPEHYGLEGCMTALWLGFNVDPGKLAEMEEEIEKPASIIFLPYEMTKLVRPTYTTVVDVMARFPKQGTIPFWTYDGRYGNPSKDKSGRVLSNVINGDHDGDIAENAKNLRKFGEQHGGFFIRTMREMNHSSRVWSWAGNSSKFKKAWVRIWTIFENEGANQYATWVWNPTLSQVNYGSQSPGYLDRFYPGDEYVDWIGLNCHDYSHQSWGRGTGTLFSMFGRSYAHIRKAHPSKPIMIPETGTEEGKHKARWVADAFRSVRDQFPGIKALNWWSQHWSSGRVKDYNGEIDSSPEALQAFKESISDPYFLGKVPYRG